MRVIERELTPSQLDTLIEDMAMLEDNYYVISNAFRSAKLALQYHKIGDLNLKNSLIKDIRACIKQLDDVEDGYYLLLSELADNIEQLEIIENDNN